MQLSPDESKLLSRCEDILSLENNPGWLEIRAVVEGRISDIEAKIAQHIEDNYAPKADYVAALVLARHERQQFLQEVLGWFESARRQKAQLEAEIAEYSKETM